MAEKDKAPDEVQEKVHEEQDEVIEAAEDVETAPEDQCHCAEQLEKLEKLEREKADVIAQLLRLKADFENFRRRSRVQMEDMKLNACKDLIGDLLPVLDDFERALLSGNERADDPLVQGVQMVYNRLMNTLGTYGLEKIGAAGQLFDPDYHEAVSVVGEAGDNLQVFNELQTGYLLNGKVLRHTRVQVGQLVEEDE